MQLNNLAGPLGFRAQIAPDSVALIHGEKKLTYAALWQEVARFATLFSEIGIDTGERVAVFLENRQETIAACAAAAAIGAIVVPINWMLRAPQVSHILRHCAATCLVSSAARLRMLATVLDTAEATPQLVSVDQVPPELDHALRRHRLEEFWAGSYAIPERAPTIDEDAALILYTSGSTGQPKGVLLSHRNMVNGAFAVASYLRMRPEDRILCATPMGFDAGFNQVTSTLFVGATAVLHNYTRPLEVVRCCDANEVTGATGVPPFWMDISAVDWPDRARKRLRYFANTGGQMPQSTLARLRALFVNAAPYLMYGLTEAYRSTYLNPALVEERPGSIGKAIPNARVSVRRADGSLCEPREIGELVHAGASVALGYWNDPEATAKRFHSLEIDCGGLRRSLPAVWSGDLVWQDEDGFLYFVGRNDAMIKSCGCRVSPTEVEDVALASGLAREAVAVGLPDLRRGQVIALALGGANTSDEQKLKGGIIRHFRASAPGYMIPEIIVVTEQLPRTATGKFDRERCSEMLAALYTPTPADSEPAWDAGAAELSSANEIEG